MTEMPKVKVHEAICSGGIRNDEVVDYKEYLAQLRWLQKDMLKDVGQISYITSNIATKENKEEMLKELFERIAKRNNLIDKELEGK